MYPKDRLPRSKAQHIPPNLMTLFAHVMSRASEGNRGSIPHTWEEVLQPAAAGNEPGAFPMSAQDWRKTETFCVQLQELIATRRERCPANGSSQDAIVQNGGSSPHAASNANSSCASSVDTSGSEANVDASSSSNGKTLTHSNGKVKSKGKPTTPHASHSASMGTATPAPENSMPRHVPRVTPKESSRIGEPSAPTKVVGRVAAARRVNGGADGAVASLAGSRAVPGAFETPSHSHHSASSPGEVTSGASRSRDHSPSRYPARLRSRRFPHLSKGGETPEVLQPRGVGQGCDGDADQTQGRRSPRHNHHLPRTQGRILASDQQDHDWLNAGDNELRAPEGCEDGKDDQSYGMRTRAVPKPPFVSMSRSDALAGTSTPQASTVAVGMMGVEFGASSAASGANAGVSGPREEVPRPRQVLQGGGRSGSRAPLPRSSVGGRNYTDNHVKQLGLIEAAVVASATPEDHAMYNLPRQGRTLTLTNVFKFVALRGASAMYNLATQKQVEAHTGRHSNFFDGKIDARIVGVIKRDIGDETITKSRKFSKILLSLVAEGCTDPDCGWDHSSFTSENIAKLQAKLEAETGTSALKHFHDSAQVSTTPVAAPATTSTTPAPGNQGGVALSGSPVNGAPSKRRLDLGRDEGQTPSPRMKKLKRAARNRFTGGESTPTTAEGVGNARSPPKEEDDMRAAEVLQGLKGIGGSSG